MTLRNSRVATAWRLDRRRRGRVMTRLSRPAGRCGGGRLRGLFTRPENGLFTLSERKRRLACEGNKDQNKAAQSVATLLQGGGGVNVNILLVDSDVRMLASRQMLIAVLY